MRYKFIIPIAIAIILTIASAWAASSPSVLPFIKEILYGVMIIGWLGGVLTLGYHYDHKKRIAGHRFFLDIKCPWCLGYIIWEAILGIYLFYRALMTFTT